MLAEIWHLVSIFGSDWYCYRYLQKNLSTLIFLIFKHLKTVLRKKTQLYFQYDFNACGAICTRQPRYANDTLNLNVYISVNIL